MTIIENIQSFSNPLSSKVDRLKSLLDDLSTEEIPWVIEYLKITSQNSTTLLSKEEVTTDILTILYGSQTGNSKGVATLLAEDIKDNGVNVRIISTADYDYKKIKKETHLILVISTHGEGEPPDSALGFYNFIMSARAPKLNTLMYSIIGLGDSSYEFFCKTAMDFDERFKNLGATPITDRIECDIDYDDAIDQWQCQNSPYLVELLNRRSSNTSNSITPLSLSDNPNRNYTKIDPYRADLLEKKKITGRKSAGEVWHLEIDIENSGIHYEPGDSLGVWFKNDEALVFEILVSVCLSGEITIDNDGSDVTLEELLQTKYELTRLHPGFIKAYGEASQNKHLLNLVNKKDELRSYIEYRQIIDVVREHPSSLSENQFLSCLRKMAPRLYSISSSQKEVENEVHITVSLVEYKAFNHWHQGAASSDVIRRSRVDGYLDVYIEPNTSFRLPADSNAPIIMIGAGTGIAPYRAFLQEINNLDFEGKSWLIYGNKNFTEDFLYQTELKRYLASGTLSRIDLAFSRDQSDKVYVQDKIRERGDEIIQWLNDGAHLYVCGDAHCMAKDVHQALIDILMEYNNLSEVQAKSYLDKLRESKHYQKDVY